MAALALFAWPLPAQRNTELFEGREVAAREVLVKFRSADTRAILQAEQAEDVDTAERVNQDGVLNFHSRSKDTATLVANLSRRADVLYAEPNFIVQSSTTPNDTRFPELWGLKNTGQTILGAAGTAGAHIHAEPAWTVTTGTAAVVVGVVDTGIDYTHPDLAANVWNNPGAGGCPADTHGYNAITKTCDPMDDHYHGTHVSGTIGAAGNNGLGVVGVNWTTSIMGLKFLDSTGSGTLANAIAAIDFAVQTKIAGINLRILSNSWGGGGFSQSLLDEINKAGANDILFVAAAGNAGANNDTTPNYPSNYAAPNVIAVAATDNQDALASFSNYGKSTVHLGAPGVSILSTQPGGLYQYLSGTSMATPHVAGAAALILSKVALNTADLKNTILSSIDPIPSLSGKTITGGRLNVCRAIPGCPDYLLSTAPANVSVTPSSGSGTSQLFSFVFSDPYGSADIHYVEMLFQTSMATAGACYVQYNRVNNTIDLVSDSGSAYAGSGTPGVAGTVGNSQCTVDAGGSSVARSGNTLTVTLALSFKTAFIGSKNIYMNAFNIANVASGWQAKGGWTVTIAPPANVSVTPGSGSGSSQAFSFAYSDPYGYSDLHYVEMLFQTSLSAANACYVQYNRFSNTIDLVSDSGSAYVGSVTPGAAGTVGNSQCRIDGGASSVASSGASLTVTLALSFQSAFSGTKNIYMNAVTSANIASGWQAKGAWTVTLAPANVSVTPASGSGASQAFRFTYSDPNGYADIHYVEMLFQTSLSAANACYVQYNRIGNTIDLVSDSGSAYAGSGTPGVAGRVSNSQCTVDAGASSAAGSGASLTVTLALSFKPAFTGSKNIYMNAVSSANVASGWQAKGAWTP